MPDFIRVEQREGENLFDLIGSMPDKAVRLLRATIEDIADRIENQARANAPEGETGALKAHAVERRDLKRRVQGPGGLVVKSEISVPDKPKYAKWVHDGTGIYGPRGTPILPKRATFMRFQIDGKWFAKRSVLGQQPQPYLKEAVEEIERTYVPIKLAELRARLETLT
jgi:hypothetical protein